MILKIDSWYEDLDYVYNVYSDVYYVRQLFIGVLTDNFIHMAIL